MHRSLVNTTPTPRRVFSVCYIDADTRRNTAPTEEPGWPLIFPQYRAGGLIDNQLVLPAAALVSAGGSSRL